MNAASCYRPVDLQLCQGDILERVPHLYLKDFPGPIRKTTGTGNRIVYVLEELAPGAQAGTRQRDAGRLQRSEDVTEVVGATRSGLSDPLQALRIAGRIRGTRHAAPRMSREDRGPRKKNPCATWIADVTMTEAAGCELSAFACGTGSG